MNRLRHLIFSIGMLLTVASVYSQGVITGLVKDGEVNGPLPGASVIVKGTSKGTSTDFDGKFTLEVSKNSGVLVVSYVGFTQREVKFNLVNGTAKVNVSLTPDAQSLEEVVVVGSGVVDLVRDRQTPIAATTISAAVIQEKVGNLEFPEVLKGVPSVHTMNTGGYGDGSYTVRGFDQANVLVLINGQPVNDMEWGGVYWSNWSGLTDVASVVQQQRGLGSSKIGIPSVGGTTNIVTKAADRKEGGFFKATVANDSYLKSTLSYNSGLNEKGWAVSALMSYWKGNGYMDATAGKGGTYFLSIGYKPSDEHQFNFTLTGAPQEHNFDYRESIETYEKYGYKYNSNWGYRNGEIFTFNTNFYHKPIANLNWDWNINEKTNLSTVVYGSWGIGGGTGTFGVAHYRLPDLADGTIDIDGLVKANSGQTVEGFKTVTPWDTTANGGYKYWNNKRVVTGRGPGTVLRSSVNQHSWYGLLSNIDYKITDNLTFNTGLDLRTYVGKHYRVINDLLGADAYYDTADMNSSGIFVSDGIATNSLAPLDIKNAQKVNRNFDSSVRWAGWFGQLEYASDRFTAFVQGSLSNQAYMRQEFFTVPTSESKTDWSDIWGGNIKGGVNVILNDKNNVFFNAGYFSRQPFFSTLYPFNYTPRANERVEAKNEGVTSFEAGYIFDTRPLRAVLNAYYSKWDDRQRSFTADDASGNRRTARGYVGQVHKGVELEITARPTNDLNIFGMVSVGNWEYQGGSSEFILYDDLGTPSGGNVRLYLDDVKVGGSPQLQTRLGFKYNLIQGLSVDADWFYNANNYAFVDAVKFTKKDSKNIVMPSYNLFDAGVSYKLDINSKFAKSLNFRFNVNNLFDELYIARGYTNYEEDSDSSKNWKGINKKNTVEFGFGRTWNFSATLRF